MAEAQPSAAIEEQSPNSRGDRWLIRLSRLLFALFLSGFILILVIAGVIAMTRGTTLPWLDAFLPSLALFLSSGIVGLLIITRYPRHKVGWLVLLMGLFTALNTISHFIFLLSEISILNPANPLVGFFIWLAEWIWLTLPLIFLFFLPLFFPDGRLPSPRWRILFVWGAVGITLQLLLQMAYPELYYDQQALDPAVPAHALALNLDRVINSPMTSIIPIIAALLSPVFRYRRASTVERAQMKWVLYVLLLGTVSVLAMGLFGESLPPAQREQMLPLNTMVFFLFATALQITIGIAILRFRLYDIDLIFRRTLVYGILTIILTVIYFGSIITLQSLFGMLVGSDSPLVIVFSTLLIAALFNPLRQRIQKWIDRRFFRRRYDAQATLTRFAASLREENDKQRIVAELAYVIEESVQPEGIGIWMANQKISD